MKGTSVIRVDEYLGWNPNLRKWHTDRIKGQTYDGLSVLMFLLRDYSDFSSKDLKWKKQRTLQNLVHYREQTWRNCV